MSLAFGLFALDLLQRRLFHSGIPIALTPKVFQVLFYLASNAGRIVTKEELFQAVWPGVCISEANLTQTIFLLRNTLRRYDPHRYIITIPTRGYQLAALVRKVDSDGKELFKEGLNIFQSATGSMNDNGKNVPLARSQAG